MAIRASDEDRERVGGLLREHFSVGRLTDDELSDRLGAAYDARTRQELEDLLLDLPDAGQGLPDGAKAPADRVLTRGGRALRLSVRIHSAVFVLVNTLLVAIWLLAGGGYFWPIWPMLGWGLGLAVHWTPLLAGVGSRKRQAPRVLKPTSVVAIAESVSADRPPLSGATAPDGTVTILFSDIAGSTELNDTLGDLRWMDLLRVHHRLVRARVADHHGFEVKSQGDGFMVAFPSATNAVDCARAIQAAIAAGLGGHPDGPVRVRIGLHTGEAIREEEDFYGKNVVLAARIAAQAAPEQILVSDVVKHLVESRGDIRFGDRRDIELKGLGRHPVYEVL